jgi:hypothetical protein
MSLRLPFVSFFQRTGLLLTHCLWPGLLLGVLLIFPCNAIQADEAAKPAARPAGAEPVKPLAAVLPPEKWRQVEAAIDRALAWTAAKQVADGSFPTVPAGQPAVTSLCVLAFLSRGHLPGVGPYGGQINRAIDYVLKCQRRDGLFSREAPQPFYENRRASHTATYNHAIAGLMLGEVCGQVTGQRARNVRTAIARALDYTRRLQTRLKSPDDQGGWHYLGYESFLDSDISVTAWQLMFLRSAKNAEFNVPQQYIDDAMEFVRRCWDQDTGMFVYGLPASRFGGTRGTVGAGIVSLSMGGQHQTDMALAAGEWLLAHPFQSFGEVVGNRDKFIYGAYYCSQAAAQLGGRYWEGVYPPLVDVLLSAQSSNGSWESEPTLAMFGNELTTAMAVLSLTPPFQLLPVYQR